MRFQVLSKEDLDIIHNSALFVLEKVGVKVATKEAVKIFSDAGAVIDQSQRIVKVPEGIVKDALKKTPSSFTLVGRNEKREVNIIRGKVHTRPSTGLVNILEPNGACRRARCEDVAIVSRMVDYLDIISINSTQLFPSDVPLQVNDVYSFKIVLENTGKPIVVSPLTLDNLRYMWEIAKVIRDEESLEKKPLFCVLNCPLSPLILRDDISIFCAEKHIPTIINSAPIVGVSSPVTLAGTLVLQSAEALATITLIQLVNPGSPVVWGCKSTPLDMRYGTPLAGAVEIGLLSAAAVQIAHYYNLPAEGFGPRTDSKTLDEQNGIERAFLALLPALAGAEIISGAGNVEATATFSIEQLIIDAELYEMIFRVLRGITIDDEKLAKNVIMKVGIGGSFLKDISTARYYRSEFLTCKLFDKKDRATWANLGSKRIEQIACEKARSILMEHSPPPLENEKSNRIELIMEKLKADIHPKNL
ncbi:MAG: trimethylamine methyltransferase family protein [Candidatus Bathyarchaeia archaeon]